MNEMIFALQILIGLIIGKFKLLKWHITNLLSRFYEAVSQKNELFVYDNNDAMSSRLILKCMLLLIDLNSDIVRVHCIKSWVNQLIL